MKRFFRRPLFPFHDPFFFPVMRPTQIRVRLPIQDRVLDHNDPHSTFQRFFNEHGVKENQRAFFQKHYPEKYEKKFNPYQILGVDHNASQQQIKQAYREKALKFHPKNDSSPQAAQKFQALGKAYNQLTSEITTREQNNIFDSFFHDFDKEIQGFFKPYQRNIEQKPQQAQKVVQHTKSKQISQDEAKFIENADLYSESTYMQTKNGKNQKVVIEKQYNKDGKLLKVKREEIYKQDGSKEVTETLDDGKQVKKKVFTENKEHKKLTK